MTGEKVKRAALLATLAIVLVAAAAARIGTQGSTILPVSGGAIVPAVGGIPFCDQLGPDGAASYVYDPATATCEPPASPGYETALDLHGSGTLRWTHDLMAGAYGFHWGVTAGDVACRARLVLDGPTGWAALDSSGSSSVDPRPGPIVLDERGRVAPRTSAEGTVSTISGDVPTGGIVSLEAGTSTLWLDTDCPGDSYLLVFHYFG